MTFEENTVAAGENSRENYVPDAGSTENCGNTGQVRSRIPGVKKVPVILCSSSGAAALLYGKRKLVLLVRHGQTDWNLCLRLQGRESVPLNECGIEQSKECAGVLLDAVSRGLEISSVFASPLSRAQKTAEIIAEKVSGGVFETEEMLIERDYGELSGLTFDERCRLFPKGERQAKNMESVPDTAKRMKKALVNVTSRTEGKCVLCISHGGITNALFRVITRDRIGTGKNISVNCGISLLAVDEKATIPLAYNLTGDLFLNYTEKIIKRLGGR